MPRQAGTGRLPAVLFWSGGKDAAFALHEIRRGATWDVVALLTTVEERTRRVAMHEVRSALLAAQAASVGLPLVRVPLPPFPPNRVYEAEVGAALDRLRSRGVRHVVFGDLFLEDIRTYRERLMAHRGMECVFPLWGRDTAHLAREMIRSGLEARVVCVDTRWLPAGVAGRRFDETFLHDLPAGVDPCGENGEFHTFVTGGPMLRWPVSVRLGRRRDGPEYARVDLLPGPVFRSRRSKP